MAAGNSAGTNYGSDLTVVTPALPPVGITLAASGVTASNAILNASVNPNGAPTTVYFQWGGTTNYGNVTASNTLAALEEKRGAPLDAASVKLLARHYAEWKSLFPYFDSLPGLGGAGLRGHEEWPEGSAVPE